MQLRVYILKTVIMSLAVFLFSFMRTEIALRGKNLNKKEVLNPFDTLSYDKVIAYDYKGDGNKNVVVAKKMKLIRAEKELSEKEIASFHRIVGDTNTYGGQTAACFDPHFGLIYYKGKTVVGHISICLQCNFLVASVNIPASEKKKIYVGDDPEDFYYAHGFSKTGRIKLSEVVKSLNFSHSELDSEIFDK